MDTDRTEMGQKQTPTERIHSKKRQPSRQQSGERKRAGKQQPPKGRPRKNTGRHKKPDRYRTLRYVLVATVLMGLVLGAFLGPGFVFGLQDRYLCQDTELSMRESLDISVMTTFYEPSLGKRLWDFAEGLAQGTRYYVTSQEYDEVTTELYDRLEDPDPDTGLYQELLYMFLDLSNLPYTIMEGFTIEQWKQYVIYSEDYAKGVNFILWYLKLQDVAGIEFELLMDAEYGSLYAIRSPGNAETSVYMEGRETVLNKYAETFSGTETWNDKNKWGIENKWTLWYNFSYLFEAMDSELRDAIYSTLLGENLYLESLTQDERQYITRLIQDNALCRITDGGNALCITLHYGEHPLSFDIRIIKTQIWEDREDHYFEEYGGFVMGLSDVYGLIPEFAQENF